ncbi:MAG: anthranilate phosphoribosyltransferase [Deltaproteobacteria bacterium]|nr:anthranilate phosphoribosyltransferase [Deltaproteobacteria bacterium]
MIHSILKKLAQKQNLSEKEVLFFLEKSVSQKISPAQIGAFLMGLQLKGETAEEIAAMVCFLRKKAVPFKHSFKNAVDNCGTGGDASGTFNISTSAALLAAKLGAVVIKHGNRAVSSSCGSADVLEALDYPLLESPRQTLKILQKDSFCFLFAPQYHPILKKLAPIRKELGFRSLFNLAAPLANPAHVKRQLLGVSDAPLLKTYAEVLQKLGCEHALVVCGKEGLDEISLSGPTQVCELKAGKIRSYSIQPEDFGFKRCSLEDLKGGSATKNAQILRALFKGKKGPKLDVAILNAAAVLYVAGKAKTLQEGVKQLQQFFLKFDTHEKPRK